MSDIELVIKIPEQLVQFAHCNLLMGGDMPTIAKAISNGVELPKGHGRLIDADTLEGHKQIQIVPSGNGKYTEVTTYYQNDIDSASTIIERYKGE